MSLMLLTNETSYFLDSLNTQPFLNESTISNVTLNSSKITLSTNTTSRITDSSDFARISYSVVDYLLLYYTPLVIVVGSIGNILSVMVFFRTRLKKLSSSYYLSALGLSDTGFLLCNLFQWLGLFNIHFYNMEVLCQLFTYLSNLCATLSVWFVVAFTVERFIAVLYPLKRQTMCTVRRAKSVLAALTLISSIHCSPLLLFSSPQMSKHLGMVICDVLPFYSVHMKYFNYYDTLISFILPLTIIVILNSITIYTVRKLAGVRRTMTNHKRKKPLQLRNSRRQHVHNDGGQIQTELDGDHSHNRIPSCTHLNGHHSMKQSCPKTNLQRISSSSQMKVTKMLLIVSTVFVILNLPSYVLRVRAFLLDPKADASSVIVAWQYIAQAFFLTNFGINFVLYCMSGQNFRKEILGIFRRSSARRIEVGTQVTVTGV